MTPRLREVGPVERCTDCERDSTGFLEAGNTLGMGPLGRLQLAVYPVGKREQQSCTAPPDMIVYWQKVQCPSRLLHGTGHIAERLGAEGPGESDRPGQRPELFRIHNHHPDRRGLSRSVARVARSAQRL